MDPFVGVFDSGLGGLTVVKALSEHLPTLSIVYFGDTARFPYGTKTAETISRYAIENTIFLLEHGAKVIIVACNTATSVALDRLKGMFSVPIFGVIEPAARRSVEVSRSGRIGVIATMRTVKSKSYEKAIMAHAPHVKVFSQACPLLVSLIEDGCPDDEAARLIIRAYLAPLKRKKIDTLLLGCTHYPLLYNLIREEVGEAVSIIDPATALAEEVVPYLPAAGSQRQSLFFASDDPERFRKIGGKFLGQSMMPVKVYASV